MVYACSSFVLCPALRNSVRVSRILGNCKRTFYHSNITVIFLQWQAEHNNICDQWRDYEGILCNLLLWCKLTSGCTGQDGGWCCVLSTCLVHEIAFYVTCIWLNLVLIIIFPGSCYLMSSLSQVKSIKFDGTASYNVLFVCLFVYLLVFLFVFVLFLYF